MSKSLDALNDRTMSSYPLSIGTALALESIAIGPNPVYDPDRIIPNKVDLNKYDEVWICLFTLFRNIFNSLSKEQAALVMPIDIAQVMQDEANIIESLINDITRGKCNVVYYASDYSGLEKVYPKARLRSDTTPKQIIYTEMMVSSTKAFYLKHGNREKYKHFKLHLEVKERENVLIFTNYAHDLLSHKHFQSLELLESHTGLIKGRSLWYTKYQDGKNLMRIPFNKVFLQIFGDSHTFFAWPKPARDDIISLSEKYKWTQQTTKERILFSLNTINDAYLSSIVKSMF